LIPIKIDASALQQEFNLSNQNVSDLKQELLSGLCNELARQWSQQAREKLKSTRSEYIRSLKVFKEGEFRAGIELVGWLPNRIEGGCSPFDMKLKMLKSSKVKIGNSGQSYITIPFRIGVPTTLGDNDFFSSIMSPSTYKVAKALQGKQQVKQSQLSGSDAILQTRAFVKNQTQIFEAYTHKSSVFAGIQKGQGQFHGQYNTFRRISSTGSDPNSWIFSGIKAYHLAEAALDKMNVVLITDQTIDNFLNSMGF
jgi:hypothetical protein